MATDTKPLVGDTSSDKQRLLGALLLAIRNNEMQSDQSLPAIVKSFDRVNNVAVVQPLIRWIDVNGGQHSRHPLTSINVLSLGGGGFNISFPLAEGDLGWIIAADRDISIFKQSLQESNPNTGRFHKFEDAWFVPDVFRKYTINAEDSAAMVIQSLDSATRISISEGQIKITAPTTVIVDTPEAVFTGNVTVEQNVQINQTLDVDGVTSLHGGLVAESSAALPNGTTVGGINVSTHGHISSSPGNRTTGNMIP